MFVRRFAGRVRNRLRPTAPSLVMRYDGPGDLPPKGDSAAARVTPEGFVVRTLAEAERLEWVRLMNDNGELGQWTEDRFHAETTHLVEGLLLVVVADERLVATASVHDDSIQGGPAWSVGWVARHPDFRALGLGELVVSAAVQSALQLPKRPIILRTEDHRIDAIRLYLRLGFKPDLSGHASHEARWRKLGAITGAVNIAAGHWQD